MKGKIKAGLITLLILGILSLIIYDPKTLIGLIGFIVIILIIRSLYLAVIKKL